MKVYQVGLTGLKPQEKLLRDRDVWTDLFQFIATQKHKEGKASAGKTFQDG